MKKSTGAKVIAEAARVLRVIGHPARLSMIETLRSGERCVSEFQASLGLTQPIISQHLSVLKRNKIVRSRREGNRIYYSIAHPRVLRVIDCIRSCPNGGAGRRNHP